MKVKLTGLKALFICAAACLLAFACAHALKAGIHDSNWYAGTEADYSREAEYSGMAYSSHYISMRDGVRIAVDLYLPKGLKDGARIPAILHQTCYMRSIQLRWPFRIFLGGKPFDHTFLYAKRREYFVRRGYAWLDVDIRGSGASEGLRMSSWSPDEVKDYREIVDWIVSRTWSDGKVGSTGVSYDGISSGMLLVVRHPAVKAVVPMFALYDTYTDAGFPGGIISDWFLRNWQRITRYLEQNRVSPVGGWWTGIFVRGVTPVAADKDRSILKGALKAHEANYLVHDQASHITFRDDIAPGDPRYEGIAPEDYLNYLPGKPLSLAGSIGLFSPHNYVEDIRASGAAIYSYSGWLDGGYPIAAIKWFLNVKTPGSRLILGPWNHGGGWNVNPNSGPSRSNFDRDLELLRFFDRYLKGLDTGIDREKPVHYYTMVEEKWKESDTWPPEGIQSVPFYFSSGGSLSSSAPQEEEASDAYKVDYTANTRESTRWRNQLEADAPIDYGERNKADSKLLVYTSSPLERDTEVTGHPIVTIHAASSATDGTFIAYLEDVDEDGDSNYVTEGLLRAIHRKLSNEEPLYVSPVPYRSFMSKDAMPLVKGEAAEITFDLLPTSYLFRKGHRIRVAIAGADASHFAPLFPDPPEIKVYRDRLRSSRIDLPISRR